MADELTAQQKKAVENRGGTLLVSAAAGSGKTKVLVDRLMLYLTDPVDPANLDDFLIITYTKAAASELRGKIAAKLTERIAQEPENQHLMNQLQRLFLTKISTVHGFCGDILREYAYRLELSADFRVADENECRELRQTVLSDLLDRAYETMGDDPDFRAFVDTQGIGRDDRLVPELVEKVYDSARCHKDPALWLNRCLEQVQAQGVQDAGETTWGEFLMEDLFAYLDCQIAVMETCVSWAEGYPELEKPAQVLADALYQLQALRESETWDQVVAQKDIKFGTLRLKLKNNPDMDTSDRVKAAWDGMKAGLKKKLRAFEEPSSRVLEDLSRCAQAARGLKLLVEAFDEAYTAAKKTRRCLDFSDLEHKTLDLLWGKSRTAPTAAAAEIGNRFREVLVDEYQDSNAVQDAIFDAITRKKQNCFLVGDVKQSIYQFRLADPEIFLEKYRKFAPAEKAKPGQGRKIFLSDNFRSGGEVVEAVNDVFRCCMRPTVGGLRYGDAEALREGIPHEPLPDPAVELYLVEALTDGYNKEAAFVAQRIQEMLKNGTLIRDKKGMRPVTADDIVILLRSPGSAGAAFQQALEKRGIRCASGGGADLLQAPEIGVLRSLLQTIRNPRQDIPLISLLASPVFGFTADDLAVIRAGRKWGSVYDALLASPMPKARYFLEILARLRQAARMDTLTALLEKCLSLTRLDSIYASLEDGQGRLDNIRTFFQLAASFESGSLKDMGQFLEHLEALEQKGLTREGGAGSGCVTIMSIHKSKGLEFPVVFLGNLSRSFNMESLRAQILCDKDLGLGLSAADPVNRVRYPSLAKRAIGVKMARESVSEEMRVLYVALTRARDRLIMTYADKRPDKTLGEIAQRMDFDGGELLCREASCPGDWVLLSALGRTEAGKLHALGGRPKETRLSRFPWKIDVVTAPEETVPAGQEEKIREDMPRELGERLGQELAFRYPYEAATRAPSKQTATGRKGRVKDEEAAENTKDFHPRPSSWRRPAFGKKAAAGKERGTAIHAALQYIHFEACTGVDGIRQELERLTRQKFLTPDQAALVEPEKLAALFATDLGQKLRTGNCLREFKFSILDPGEGYGENLEGEQVLLQGVVDCALIEEDGITIIDFKTDYVSQETVPALVERYRLQLQTYSDVMERIYEKKVKGQYLYLFALDKFVEVPLR